MRLTARLAMVLPLLLLGGCAAPALGDERETSASAIVDGVDDARHASVALIRMTLHKADGTTEPSFCSGSLVAPNLLLTAAHCHHGFTSTTSDWTVSFDETMPGGEMKNAIAVDETKILVHPAFGGWAGRNDVALVPLPETPPGLEPVPIARRLPFAAAAMEGKSMTVVGYGGVGKNETGDVVIGGNDRRREVDLAIVGVSPWYIETYDTKGFCGGDSGGPALMVIDGKEQMVGINVLSNVSCRADKATLRLDEESEVRAFLKQHVPNLE